MDNKEWYVGLQRDEHGKIKDTLINLRTIMLMDAKLAGIAYNTQTHRIMAKERLPWGTANEYFTDMDEACLKVYIAEKYGFDPSKKLSTVIMNIGSIRKFNPVKDYLEGLPQWDGVERADNLLVKYFNAEASDYVKAVTRKTLVAAIARIYQPGIKFDYVLILNGDQGIGKSELFARLGGVWYSNSLHISDMKDKAAAEKLQGKWILELAELSGFSKADDDMLKSFVTCTDDEYRDSYGKYCSSHKRQCILVGTTNKQEGFLKDVTGNRRYWPVKVFKSADYSVFKMPAEEVEQIWAECLIYYKQGEELFLDEELEKVAMEMQKESLEQDSRAGVIKEYLERPIPNVWDFMPIEARREWLTSCKYSENFGPLKLTKRERVSNIEIWTECFGKAKANMNRTEAREISKIMSTIDNWHRGGKMFHFEYGQQRCYERVN